MPEYCRATYDRRLLVGETKESVLEPINGLAGKLMAEDPELKVKASYAVGKGGCHTGNEDRGAVLPGWLYDKDDDFVQAVYTKLTDKGLLKEITRVQLLHKRRDHYAGEAKEIKTFGLGPSRENLATR